MTSDSDWLELQVVVDPARRECIEEHLSDCGALAVTLAGAGDDEVLEPAAGAQPLWQALTVRGLFSGQHDPLALMAAVVPLLDDAEASSLQLRRVADQPWERAWLEHFHTMHFGAGSNLVVCPTTEPPPIGAVVLRLDPGLAFGTGTHATTALCLDYLADHPPTSLDVLDLGCGSGILALAAKLLGATRVTAIDNDPQALLATEDNARRNAAIIHTQAASVPVADDYDLVIANILAGVLIELAPQVAQRVRQRGQLLLSGILEDQTVSVQNAYSKWFEHWHISRRDGWVALSATACGTPHVHPVS